jgi:hypothetical protein
MSKVSDLPRFKYHPSPLSTGAIEDSPAVCECCGQARGFIYREPIYCRAEVENVCPWCIADGAAHAKWDAEFTDFSAVGGYGKWCDVPDEVRQEVAHRTPGFSTIQEARWWTHCRRRGGIHRTRRRPRPLPVPRLRQTRQLPRPRLSGRETYPAIGFRWALHGGESRKSRENVRTFPPGAGVIPLADRAPTAGTSQGRRCATPSWCREKDDCGKKNLAESCRSGKVGRSEDDSVPAR